MLFFNRQLSQKARKGGENNLVRAARAESLALREAGRLT